MAETVSTGGPGGVQTLMRAYLRKKMLGQVTHFSAALETNGQLLDMALEAMAKELARGAKRAGLSIIPDDGDVYVTPPGGGNGLSDPMTHGGSLAAKLGTEWSERPVDLLIFAVHAMLDAQEREKAEEKAVDRQRRRYTRLLERLLAAKNMKEVRAAVNRDDDYD